MNIETVIKNVKKDLELTDNFFEMEIDVILDILRKRLKRYAKKKPSKKKKKVKESWFVD